MSGSPANWTTLCLDVAAGDDQQIRLIPDISDSDMNFIRLTLMVVALMSVSTFGILANILNVHIYLKMKMTDSITVQFIALSLSDLAGSALALFISICFLILELSPDLAVDPYSLVYIVAAGVRVLFSDMSMSFTVFISLERCLGVVRPVAFKNFHSPSTSVKIILLVVVLVPLCYVPNYATAGLAWQWDHRTNSSRLLARYTGERNKAEAFTAIFMSITWGTIAHSIILVSSCVMSYKLKQASRFRQNATGVKKKGDVTPPPITRRDSAIIRLVMAISWLLIICNLPVLSFSWARNFVPQLRSSKKYKNLTTTIFALANNGMCINASINIFAYYKLSSKYRTCFKNMLCK